MKSYELVSSDRNVELLVQCLVNLGYLREVHYEGIDFSKAVSMTTKEYVTGEQAKKTISQLPEPELPPAQNGYLRNGFPIESNIESISKAHLGSVDERKFWIKELKAAVKEYGHDEILNAFYEWSLSQNNSMIRKPVTFFLKNVGSHIASVNKPSVTNPILDRVEQRIAYVTDNKVFFAGEYRFKLATLLKDHGDSLVIEAFENFYQDVDDKGIPWAARDFLQRASVMITTILKKKAEVRAQDAALAETIRQARQTATEEVEGEEQEL